MMIVAVATVGLLLLVLQIQAKKSSRHSDRDHPSASYCLLVYTTNKKKQVWVLLSSFSVSNNNYYS
jgi:hypothetical protein